MKIQQGIDVKTTVNVFVVDQEVFFTRKLEDIEWVYFNESPDVDVIATSENSISGISEKHVSRTINSIDNLPEFSSFARMRSSNPAFVPKYRI